MDACPFDSLLSLNRALADVGGFRYVDAYGSLAFQMQLWPGDGIWLTFARIPASETLTQAVRFAGLCLSARRWGLSDEQIETVLADAYGEACGKAS